MENTNIFSKIGNGFCKVEKTITWIVFAFMLALLLIQVFCRFVLKMPLAWSEELVRYTYVAVSFTGAIVAVHEHSHISIDILPSMLAMKIKDERKLTRVLDSVDIFASAVQVVLFVILTKWMIDYNIDIQVKGQITTAMQFPIWIFCLPVTISLALMAFHNILNILSDIMKLVGKGGAK